MHTVVCRFSSSSHYCNAYCYFGFVLFFFIQRFTCATRCNILVVCALYRLFRGRDPPLVCSSCICTVSVQRSERCMDHDMNKDNMIYDKTTFMRHLNCHVCRCQIYISKWFVFEAALYVWSKRCLFNYLHVLVTDLSVVRWKRTETCLIQ